MELKSKQIKLFYPHAEVRIFVTEEMIKDYKRCTEETKRYLESEIEPDMKCEDFSWKDCEIFGFNLCEIQQLKEKMDELIGGMEQCQ